MQKIILVLWTSASSEEAKKIIHKLLEKKWIACANIVPKIESIYTWEEKIEETEEVLIFLKTVQSHFESVKDYIAAHSSYDVTEVLQVDIKDGLEEYLNWVRNSTE